MGLVGEWEWSSTNTVKARDRIVEASEIVGKRSRSGRREEPVLQQKSVVSVEIHDDLKGNVGVRWFPLPPLPFSSIEFVVTIIIAGPIVTRENFSEPFERAEDREVGEETFGWRVARRSQGDVGVYRRQNLLWIESSPGPRGTVPALFLNFIQGNADGKAGRRLFESGRLPIRTPACERCLPHREKIVGLRSISEVSVSRKNADERIQVLVIDTRFGTKHMLLEG